jgi:uncharacterized protein (DUF362 family)
MGTLKIIEKSIRLHRNLFKNMTMRGIHLHSFTFDEKKLVVDEVHTQEEFSAFLDSLLLRAPFIVKPNWISNDYGHFTDPQVLEWMLRYLNERGEVVVVESYAARNMMTIPELKPPLPIFSSKELELVRKSEDTFLKETGIKEVIEDTGIEYVNIAEEVYAERTVPREMVQKMVESRYASVLRKELYEFLPKKLYALRSGTFINLAKFKVFFSMCTKNMFGMIPEHVGYDSRYDAYHGKSDADLSRNIVDINKIYHSFFNVIGMVEAINSLTYNSGNPTAKVKSGFGYSYDVLEHKGLVYYSDDTLWLDAFIHQQCERDPMETEHLREAKRVFGSWSAQLIQTAKNLSNPLIEAS